MCGNGCVRKGQLGSVRIHQDDGRTHFPRFTGTFLGIHNHHVGQSGDLVNVARNSLAFDDIGELDRTRNLGYHRVSMGVPTGDLHAGLHRIAVLYSEYRTIRKLVTFALPADFIEQRHVTGARHDNPVAALLLQQLDVIQAYATAVFHVDTADRCRPGCGAAYVESPHRQLRTGFANRLRRHYTDGFTDVNQVAARQVPAVTTRTDPVTGLAGNRRPYLYLVNTVFVHNFNQFLIQQGTVGNKYLLGRTRPGDITDQDPTQDSFPQGFDNVSPLNQRSQFYAGLRTAIVLSHDKVLGNVHQAPGQVSGIGGFQGRIRETLTGAMGRYEILQDVEAFPEVRRDRCFDDGTVRFCHQPAHAGQLPDLGRRTAGAGIRHHENRIE